MLNIKAMREEAEQGLAIAEKATEGPWRRYAEGELQLVCGHEPLLAWCGDDESGYAERVVLSFNTNFDAADDSVFVADSRTRAPAAYRNVVVLSDAVTTLREALDHVNGLHAHMTKLWEERAKVRRVHDALGLEAPLNDQVTLDVEPIVVKIGELRGTIEHLKERSTEWFSLLEIADRCDCDCSHCRKRRHLQYGEK